MSTSLDKARAALRSRQGGGARFDSVNAPARELDWARRGAAYFLRKLNELSDEELLGNSRVPGWTRRHVAACVGYHARSLAHVAEGARTGAAFPFFDTPSQRQEQIEDGATLPPGALRHLVVHSYVHLNVEWRDLSDRDWDRPVLDGKLTVRETVWLRAKEIWLRAIDLHNGGSLRDLPQNFIGALQAEGGRAVIEIIHPRQTPY